MKRSDFGKHVSTNLRITKTTRGRHTLDVGGSIHMNIDQSGILLTQVSFNLFKWINIFTVCSWTGEQHSIHFPIFLNCLHQSLPVFYVTCTMCIYVYNWLTVFLPKYTQINTNAQIKFNTCIWFIKKKLPSNWEFAV